LRFSEGGNARFLSSPFLPPSRQRTASPSKANLALGEQPKAIRRFTNISKTVLDLTQVLFVSFLQTVRNLHPASRNAPLRGAACGKGHRRGPREENQCCPE
jgi:hypothetical protein